ncbi:MAG: histidine phosphatase family protein [Candidatus Eremiobacteraeota bacterium]|nr:histidine phosphatase family protein [Candidatus Eremiobacteraeota bacterium]
MELYFLRHGDTEIALFKTQRADYERKLTEYGIIQLAKEALGLKQFVDGFDIIFTSPLVRAVQTAGVFGKIFNCEDKIITLDSLAPPTNLEELLESIAFQGDLERVLCVGHAPSLGEMATEIITGIEEDRMLPLKKGGLICIEMDRPDPSAESKLLYFIPPMFLVKLGEAYGKEKDLADKELEGERKDTDTEMKEDSFIEHISGNEGYHMPPGGIEIEA